MERWVKSFFCIHCKIPPHHDLINDFDIFFTRFNHQPIRYELQLLILLLLLQRSLLTRHQSISPQVVSCKSFSFSIKDSNPHLSHYWENRMNYPVHMFGSEICSMTLPAHGAAEFYELQAKILLAPSKAESTQFKIELLKLIITHLQQVIAFS